MISCKKIIFVFLANFFVYFSFANTVSVDNYGAIPNDGNDDTQAIINALQACDKQGATLMFSAGTYEVSGPTPNAQGGGGTIFYLIAYNNLNIVGSQTRLLGKNWATVFRIIRCNNITVEGLSIDWEFDQLPFTPGKVTSINGNYFNVNIHPPFQFKPGFGCEVYADYDSLKTRYLEGGNRYRESSAILPCTNPSPGVMRCHTTRPNLITVGNHAIIQHTKHAGNAFVLANSNNIHLEKITIFSVPGLAVALSSSTDITLENFHVKLKPNVPNWWLSSAAGATNYSNPRGVIRFSNVTLQGMGDDGANLHSRLMQVTEVVDATTLKVVDHWLGGAMAPGIIPWSGDNLSFGHSNTPFTYFSSNQVVSATNDPLGFTLIDLVAGTTGIVPGDIISNVSALPTEAIFDNCRVGKNRGRAFLISSDNVTIQNCRLEDISGPAILVHADANFFMDAKPAQNLTIKDNLLKNCNFGSPMGEGMIEIGTRLANNVLGASGSINNITIQGNTFESEHGANGIFVGSANTVHIENNSFDQLIQDRVVYENIGCNIFVNEWLPTNSTPFLGTPHSIPGTIQAEDYDLGGETVAYHDRSPDPSTIYRTDQVGLRQVGSDIVIKSTACNEWTKYSVAVTQSGYYDLVFHMIPYNAASKFRLITDQADTLGNVSITTPNGIGNPSSVTLPNVYLNRDVQALIFKVVTGGFNFDYVDVNLVQACVDVELSVALEGCYDPIANQMGNQLNVLGLLPGQTPTSGTVSPTPLGQPYHIAPWNYQGSEGLDFAPDSYSANAVDWVLASFRSDVNKTDEIAQTAGMLLQDGSVQLINRCLLSAGALSAAYVVIEHRNHIGVMSPTAVPIVNNKLSYDFRGQNSWNTATGVGQYEFGNGVWTMYAGDGDQLLDSNGFDINGADRALFEAENGNFYQYLNADFNLNGEAEGSDKILWNKNNGNYSQVPR